MTKMVAVEGEGKQLDRFELVAELASGGMATVYLARLVGVGGFQRFVAIKRLHPHLAKEAEFIQMFLDEARLAARIHHPNVVPILEIGTSDEGYYLVMEYVEGDTVGRLLARAAQSGVKIPPRIGVRMILDALAGLHAAHELKDDNDATLGLVHRDVSPQNILVGVDGSARITDFGVARATSQLSTTRTGQLKGKLAYMAPEQARAAKDIDRRADIFAMGTVLWELLACRRLFKGDGEADTMNRVLNQPIPTLRSANPSIPAALEGVVAKALERDRARRYATSAEFADALERAARVVGVLGAHREVAAHVDAVIGTEISQQRDAVRAWLSRSEPSRQGIPGLDGVKVGKRDGTSEPSKPGQPIGALSETKFEGVPRESGDASGPARRETSQPSSVSSASAAVSIPAAPASGAPEGAATAAVVPAEQATAVKAPDAPRDVTKRAMWPWIAAALLVGAGVTLFLMQTRTSGEASSAAPGDTAPAAAAPTTATPPPRPIATDAPSATTTVAASSSVDSAAASASASASARKPISPSGWPQRPVAIANTTPSAATAPTTTAAPTATATDDMSHNPYR